MDVTNLKRYTGEKGLSFYYSLVYLVVKAANSIENFRLRFIDGKIFDVSDTVPSLTFLKSGSEAFQIVNYRFTQMIKEYTPEVKALIAGSEKFMGGNDEPGHKSFIYPVFLYVMEEIKQTHNIPFCKVVSTLVLLTLYLNIPEYRIPAYGLLNMARCED